MKIERYDMIVIGAGPAGLSAAIEAAKKGLKPIVFDENAKPGGQLFNFLIFTYLPSFRIYDNYIRARYAVQKNYHTCHRQIW